MANRTLAFTTMSWLEEPQSIGGRFAKDAFIGGIAAFSTALFRIGIETIVGGVAPFILTFPACMIATLVGGGRSGMIAAVSCQILTIRYVFPNWVSPHGGLTTDLANVVLSTIALAGTVWATDSYRHLHSALQSNCAHQVRILSLLNEEMDHRTKNNFQLAANLLAHQSLYAFDPAVVRELDRAAMRLETIAEIYQNFSIQSLDDDTVDLTMYLDHIVSALRSGAVPNNIAVQYHADSAQVPGKVAVVVGLITNEWIINAIKHAFNGSLGLIEVNVARQTNLLRITVRDDGEAHDGTEPATGHGGDLLNALAETVNANIEVEVGQGRVCSLEVPI